MEELSPEFLSTVAQVSATFMGFSLLTSVFQTISSGRNLMGEEYIKKKNFFMKLVAVALFPIFVLSYPLLFSLFLLLPNRNVTEPHYLLLNAGIAVLCWCYFSKIRKYSELQGARERHKLISFKLFDFFTMRMPMIFLFLIFLISILLFFIKPISSYIFIFLILFIVAGFLLILRNLGIKIDEGVLFELSKDFKNDKVREMLEKFESEVNKAINERKELIDKMIERVNQLKDEKGKEELKRSIAEQRAEIELFENFIFKEFFKEKGYIVKQLKNIQGCITLSELSEFTSWIEQAKRVHWEFKRGTMRNKTIFNLIYGGG